MKASEVLPVLIENERNFVKFERSTVNETLTKYQMWCFWTNYFRANPDLRIGSMTKYNINRDFQCL